MPFPPRPGRSRKNRRAHEEPVRETPLPTHSEVDPRRIRDEDVLRFHVVTSEMMRVLGDPGRTTPDRSSEVTLTAREEEALKGLYTARTGVPEMGHEQTRGHVSGLERKQMCEQALAVLRSTLSLALAPGLTPERAIYDQLALMIKELRKELLQAILLDRARPGRDPSLDPLRKPEDEGEGEGDDDDDDDDDDD